MKSNSKRLIRLIKISLDVAWYANFLCIAISFGILFYLFFSGPSNNYMEMSSNVRLTGPYVFKKSLAANPEEVKYALVRTNVAYLSFYIRSSPLVIGSAFFFFVTFEALVFSILYNLRKLFTSLNKGLSFTRQNVSTLKWSALFIALILPVQFLFYLIQRYFITANFPDSYRLSVEPGFHTEVLLIAAVLYIAAEIFNYGLELKRENEEFV